MANWCLDLELSSSEYVEYASSVGTDYEYQTIEFWVTFESVPNTWSFCAQNDAATSSGWIFRHAWGETIYDNWDSVGNRNRAVWNLTPSVTGSWEHWAFVWSNDVAMGSGGGVLYIDTSDQGSPDSNIDNTVDTINNSTAPFQIGANGEDGDFYDGLIADFRIWNTARSSSNISDNYDTQVDSGSSGLVANWLFDQDLLDETSNSYDLTHSATATYVEDYPYEYGGGATTSGTGTVSGTSTASGIGIWTHSSTGNVGQPLAGVAGVGQSTAESTATAAGTSTVTAAGSATVQAQGLMQGTLATVLGVAGATGQATGTIAGTSTVSAVGQSTAEAVGTIAGTSTATGATDNTTGVGSAAGTSTAIGAAQSIAQAVGSAGGTATATAIYPHTNYFPTESYGTSYTTATDPADTTYTTLEAYETEYTES